jgi:hypothetical protein
MAPLDYSIGRAGRVRRRTKRRQNTVGGSSSYASNVAGERLTSATKSDEPPRFRGPSHSRPNHPIPTRPARRAGPCRHQKNSPAFPTEAAGAFMAAVKPHNRSGSRPDTDTSTPRSMTAPASSTRKSTPTNKQSPPSRSGNERTLPPNPARRMGLHPRLALRSRTLRALRTLRPLLHSPPSTRRPRMGNTNHDTQGQRPRSPHLGP